MNVRYSSVQVAVIIYSLAPCTHGDIRLGDDAVLRGRVEVCINGTWGTICDHHWTQQEASVACSHLGYSPYGIHYICLCYVWNLILYLGAMATTNLFLNYVWPIGLFDLRCSGNETKILDCTYKKTNGGQNCGERNDASVFCMREFNILIKSENLYWYIH